MPPRSQPPVAATASPSNPPRPGTGDATAISDEVITRLRAELDSCADAFRRARLLADLAEREERSGDDAAAVRDYQAAFSAWPAFREPLEGLLRLFEKRHNPDLRGKVVEALVQAAASPDEMVRALRMWATFLTDVASDLKQALTVGLEASKVAGASIGERAGAWLELEVVASISGDAATSNAALAQRALHADVPSWRALLLIDSAREALAAGDTRAAGAFFDEAQSFESTMTWQSALMNEEALSMRRESLDPTEARASTELWLCAMEKTASLIELSMNDGPRGDALGVPVWVRDAHRLADYLFRIADARRRLGQYDRAAVTLDRMRSAWVREGAEELLDERARILDAMVSSATIRVADRTGDRKLSARLAGHMLALRPSGGLAAALHVRIAEKAIHDGDVASAIESLSHAAEADPNCLLARTRLLDLLSTSEDKTLFCEELEKSALHFLSGDARGRTLLLAAYVWAFECGSAPRARGALDSAAAAGVPLPTISRVGRMLAHLLGHAAWLQSTTEGLLGSGARADDAVSLNIELLRMRRALGDATGAESVVRELQALPGGEWLAYALGAYLPSNSDSLPAHASERAIALRSLASLEAEPSRVAGLRLAAGLREAFAGHSAAALEETIAALAAFPTDPAIGSACAAFARQSGNADAAGRALIAIAEATDDSELGVAMRLENALGLWLGGERRDAFCALTECAALDDRVGEWCLAWVARGVDIDNPASRRTALDAADRSAGWDPSAVAFERFAIEVLEGRDEIANAALACVERSTDEAIALAGALARVAWSSITEDPALIRSAAEVLSRAGPAARTMALAEQFRIARVSSDAHAMMNSARDWAMTGGGLPAALEWATASALAETPREERLALVAISEYLEGDARDAIRAGAALLGARIDPELPEPFSESKSRAARLNHLELAPPGSDPRRRATALLEIGDALGEDATIEACALAGWSALVAGDIDRARTAFKRVCDEFPNKIEAWEGLRACAELEADRSSQAQCAAKLGVLCSGKQRAAAFWEEAGLLWLLVDNVDEGMSALESSIALDATRTVAFDKLFRWVRERKDYAKLLTLIEHRMLATDDADELERLTWERARALRECGDHDGALEALQQVTLLQPDHVGALALLGEINIRRGHFEEAARALARIALLDNAPAKNRVTAGVAAVDVYENKLGQFDRALEVLSGLHRASLSTLPVRDRLARAAARAGAWVEATAVLETLMHERPTPEGRIEAARLAVAIHRDRLEEPASAIPALRRLLEELPSDGDAIDVLLDPRTECDDKRELVARARDALIATSQEHTPDRADALRLVHIARELSDTVLERAGLGVLRTLGIADRSSELAFSRLAAFDSSAPRDVHDAGIVDGLRVGGDGGPWAELFALLGPWLGDALGPTLASLRVGRRERLDPRTGLGVWSELAAWGNAIGLLEFEVYAGGADPLGVFGISGRSPALVVGAELNAPLAPQSRARVARELFALVSGTRAVAEGDDTTARMIVDGAFDVVGRRSPWSGEARGTDAPTKKLVAKALSRMPRKSRNLLGDKLEAIASHGMNPEEYRKLAIASLDRVSLIACGDPLIALGAGIARDTGPEFVARTDALLRFIVSDRYLNARRTLGLEGGAS